MGFPCKNALYKAHTAKIMMFLMVMLISISMVSAADFDNWISYSDKDGIEDKVVTLTNWIGLGEDIGTAERMTPQVNYVMRGKDRRVMIFDIENYGDLYKDGVKDLEVIDMETGKPVDKEFHLEYAIYEDVVVDEYDKEVCALENTNYGKQEICRQVKTGEHTKSQVSGWGDLGSGDIPKGKLTIAIVTDVNADDHFDGIPIIFGRKVSRWAEWTESLNTGLQFYYKMDETSGTDMGDSRGNFTMTAPADNWTLGKIANGFETSSNFFRTDNLSSNWSEGVTFALWFNWTAATMGDTSTFLNTDDSNAGTEGNFDVEVSRGGNLTMYIHDGTSQKGMVNLGGQIGFHNWSFVTITINATTARVWVDGVNEKSITNLDTYALNDDEVNMGANAAEAAQTDAVWDELGIWARVLSNDEITQLYNAGTGMTYTDVFFLAPIVGLSTPEDAASGLPPTTFNCSSNDTGVDAGVTNLTLVIDNVANTLVTNSSAAQNLSLQTSLSPSAGTHNWTCYSSDVTGNLGWAATNRTFTIVNFVENSHSFTEVLVKGTSDTFTLNISADGDESVTATLFYAGTSQSISKFGSNKEMRFVSTFAPIDVSSNEVFWTINYGGTLTNTTIYEQNVTGINITDCTTGTNIFNFTVVDEGTKLALSGADTNLTVEIDLDITSLQGTQIANYSRTATFTNPVLVCSTAEFGSTPMILDALVRYEANGTWISEFYTIQNFSLTNSSLSNNISLYDLKTDDAQEFRVTYKDANFLPVKGSMLELQRRYIGDGIYRVVEAPPFDDDGTTLANFVLGDVIYTLQVKKDNAILATFNNVKAFCENQGTGDCQINLDSFGSSIPTVDYSVIEGVTFTMSYSEDTREASTIFSVNDGTTKQMLLNVTLYDAFGNTSICNDVLTASSGTLTCLIPDGFGNSTAIGNLFADGTFLGRITIPLWLTGEEAYGGSSVVLSIIAFLTVVGIGISGSGVLTMVMVIIGLVVNIALFIMNGGGFLGGTSVFLWMMVALGTLFWKANRRNS